MLAALSQRTTAIGLDAGWYEGECCAHGWDLPPARDRLGMLREALEGIPRLWCGESVDLDGVHRFRDAPSSSSAAAWIAGAAPLLEY